MGMDVIYESTNHVLHRISHPGAAALGFCFSNNEGQFGLLCGTTILVVLFR